MLTRTFAAEPVLAAFFARLNVAAMTALATNGVHNRVAPQGTQPPYLLISKYDERRFDTMATPGSEVVILVKAVSKAKSDLEGERMLSKGVELLAASALVVAGYRLIGLRFDGTDTPYEELVEGVLFRHFPSRYSVMVEQA